MKFVILMCFALISSSQVSYAGIWPCESNDDCALAKDAECSLHGFCECHTGFLLSEDLTRCLKISLYGEDCEETIQCSHLPSGATCVTGVCQCNEGFHYIRGRCRKYSLLNSACAENLDCYFGYDRKSVICDNNVCKCASEYYERYTNICRRKSKDIGDPCVVNEDCQTVGVDCINFKCRSDNNKKRAEDIGTQAYLNLFHLNIQFKGDGNYQGDNKNDSPIVPTNFDSRSKKAVGDKCTSNGLLCDNLQHSICANYQCVCKLGYYEEEGVCIPELGELTDNERLCKHFYNAQNNECICEPNYFYEPGLRDCRKPINPIEGRCTSISQCSPYGASYCRQERPRICECYNYAIYDEGRQICLPATGLGSYCENITDCHLANTVCSIEKVCVCKEKFIANGNGCSPNIGGECRSDEECVVDNTVCVTRFQANNNDETVCQCKIGYVEYKEMCVKEVTETDEECSDKVQCTTLLGELAQCIENTCSCGDANHLNNGQCHIKRMLGDQCQKNTECFLEENNDLVECRNSICRCQFGYNTDIERKICIISKSNSSGRPSPLKVVTLLLIASPFLVTGAALKEAYF